MGTGTDRRSDRRSPFDPLVHVSRLNVRTDRRHDRRALSTDEFTRLIRAKRGHTINIQKTPYAGGDDFTQHCIVRSREGI